MLYAEKASLSNGTILKSLDPLLDETIQVADSGYLVLIHETGIPVEFSGDTIISLIQLRAILNPPQSEKSRKRLNKNSIPLRHTYNRSIGLDYLTLSNPVEARKTRLSRTGSSMDSHPTEGIKYPPLINGRIYFGDDVKIIWDAQLFTNQIIFKDGFKVRFENFFGDPIRTIDVEGRELVLSEGELFEITARDKNVIFYITDSFVHGMPRGVSMSPFYTKAIQFPYSKNITSASAALMAGFFFETTSLQDSIEARPYFELATQLSDKQFYRDMLSNYLKRTGQ
ncbi:MAG: hypothetical protein BroJett042_22820 [Bacteroidota bacterium]|nr:MAG: hypothetical protein BroJett042_22820 [Bacteroidota bacterium]